MTDSKSEHHRREEFPEKFTPEHDSLKGEFATEPGEGDPLEKEPILSGKQPYRWEENLSAAPSGMNMHRYSGGILMLIFMIILLVIGGIVINSLFDTFSNYPFNLLEE